VEWLASISCTHAAGWNAVAALRRAARRMNIRAGPRYHLYMSSTNTPSLAPGTVDVWQLPLDAAGDVDEDVALLSPAERERFRLRAGVIARRFARAHAGLRRIVADYCGVAPGAVDVLAPYGRAPRTASGDLELSLSHSDGLALVAVASTPVGVDVEMLATTDGAGDELESMAEMTLSPHELALFRATAPEGQARSWLRSWTRKEAWMKACGRGIADQVLSEIDVSADSLNAHALVDLVPGGAFVGAVAVAHPSVRVVWKELRP